MRDLLQLLRQRGVQLRMLMPVQVGPDGRIGVEIFAAFRVAQHRAVAVRDDNRLARQPVLHLREGMPDVAVIKFGQLMHAGDLAERRREFTHILGGVRGGERDAQAGGAARHGWITNGGNEETFFTQARREIHGLRFCANE